jgi:hypothetical protein
MIKVKHVVTKIFVGSDQSCNSLGHFKLVKNWQSFLKIDFQEEFLQN